MPPSANRMWRAFGGRIVATRELREYKALVRRKALVAGVEPLEGDVALELVVRFAPGTTSDLSNRIKALEDALQGVAYENDRQVVRLEARRGPDAFPPLVEVNVTPWEAP